eukprot:c3500_g1_i1.p1 GENE.c3500_g1_i1~~c3500_g1_i1.p1  ORF type:complete len:433 (-),score=95.36 c3500_g1_i1:141-1439(-)
MKPGCEVLQHEAAAHVFTVRNRCDWCAQQASTPKQCAACKSVTFCNRDCFTKAWNTYHKFECSNFAKAIAEPSPPSALRPLILLSIRLISKWRTFRSGKDIEWYNDNKFVTSLCSARDKMTPEELFTLGTAAKRIAEATEDHSTNSQNILEGFANLPFEKLCQEILFLLTKLQVNIAHVCDDELLDLGVALYPYAAITNHSCAPNCAFMFSGTSVVLMALTNIRANEEITVSYCDLSLPSRLRRTKLSNKYFFECSCSRCISNKSEPCEEAMNRIFCPNCAAVCHSAALKCEKCGSDVDGLYDTAAANTQRWEMCSGVLDPHHHVLLEATESRMARALQDQNFEVALDLAQQLVAAYRATLPGKFHPLITVKLAQLGKLQSHLGRTQEAVLTLQQALESATITHPTSSAMTSTHIEPLLGMCRAELRNKSTV